MQTTCLACQLNQNPKKAPGGRLKNFNHWFLEHIIEPVPICGWLILKTKRHTEGIMGLNTEEAQELGKILDIVPKILKQVTKAEMVYVICLTEEVKHLHIHIIPRHKNETKKGFDLCNKMIEVKQNKIKPIKIDDVIKLINKLKEKLS